MPQPIAFHIFGAPITPRPRTEFRISGTCTFKQTAGPPWSLDVMTYLCDEVVDDFVANGARSLLDRFFAARGVVADALEDDRIPAEVLGRVVEEAFEVVRALDLDALPAAPRCTRAVQWNPAQLSEARIDRRCLRTHQSAVREEPTDTWPPLNRRTRIPGARWQADAPAGGIGVLEINLGGSPLMPGDGPLQLSGPLPNGLEPGVDYFVTAVDGDRVSLSASQPTAPSSTTIVMGGNRRRLSVPRPGDNAKQKRAAMARHQGATRAAMRQMNQRRVQPRNRRV